MKNIKLWIFIGIIVVILVLNHIFGWSEWLRKRYITEEPSDTGSQEEDI